MNVACVEEDSNKTTSIARNVGIVGTFQKKINTSAMKMSQSLNVQSVCRCLNTQHSITQVYLVDIWFIISVWKAFKTSTVQCVGWRCRKWVNSKTSIFRSWLTRRRISFRKKWKTIKWTCCAMNVCIRRWMHHSIFMG